MTQRKTPACQKPIGEKQPGAMLLNSCLKEVGSCPKPQMEKCTKLKRPELQQIMIDLLGII